MIAAVVILAAACAVLAVLLVSAKGQLQAQKEQELIKERLRAEHAQEQEAERARFTQEQEVAKARHEQEQAQERERHAREQEASRLKHEQEQKRAQELLKLELKELAGSVLSDKAIANRESLELLLKPFRDNIVDFRTRVEHIYADENTQRGELKGEIKRLQELNKSITEQTTNLTQALRGNSKVQGDWGEMILETILESSNLVSGIHYTTQQNIKSDEGANLRPDVILNLPGGKKIVVDSKVSLTAFVEHSSCDDPADRRRFLDEHIASVRRHVVELGAKKYQDLLESPDFVIMFVPNEPAFMAALQSDSSIWDDAYRRKVIISSPTNLFALLKIVDDLWKRDNQSRNAIAIADEGAKMYDKFVGFVETMQGVGKGLRNASEGWEVAMKQLQTGPGNLVRRAENLQKLGVKAAKQLSLESVESEE